MSQALYENKKKIMLQKKNDLIKTDGFVHNKTCSLHFLVDFIPQTFAFIKKIENIEVVS